MRTQDLSSQVKNPGHYRLCSPDQKGNDRNLRRRSSGKLSVLGSQFAANEFLQNRDNLLTTHA